MFYGGFKFDSVLKQNFLHCHLCTEMEIFKWSKYSFNQYWLVSAGTGHSWNWILWIKPTINQDSNQFTHKTGTGTDTDWNCDSDVEAQLQVTCWRSIVSCHHFSSRLLRVEPSWCGRGQRWKQKEVNDWSINTYHCERAWTEYLRKDPVDQEKNIHPQSDRSPASVLESFHKIA